jgi:hypothetical protein
MQFVVRVDVENAVVRILSDHAMQLLPLTLLLKPPYKDAPAASAMAAVRIIP